MGKLEMNRIWKVQMCAGPGHCFSCSGETVRVVTGVWANIDTVYWSLFSDHGEESEKPWRKSHNIGGKGCVNPPPRPEAAKTREHATNVKRGEIRQYVIDESQIRWQIKLFLTTNINVASKHGNNAISSSEHCSVQPQRCYWWRHHLRKIHLIPVEKAHFLR